MKPTFTILTEKGPDLKSAQQAVGGYIERVSLPNGNFLLVDEEGLLKQLPINVEATNYALRAGYRATAPLVGNVLALEDKARKGWRNGD